jgi:hypothetical protein
MQPGFRKSVFSGILYHTVIYCDFVILWCDVITKIRMHLRGSSAVVQHFVFVVLLVTIKEEVDF